MFIRLGSDFLDNYYEYEIPLKVSDPAITDPLVPNTIAYKAEVWRPENQVDFPLEILKALKVQRNEEDYATNVRYFFKKYKCCR